MQPALSGERLRTRGWPRPARPARPGADDAKVRRAWSRLVAAQSGFLKSQQANPWAFAELVRDLHACLQEATVLTERDRYDILFALGVGPGHEGYRGVVYHDKLLRKHWNEWGKDAAKWGKTDFAYWRFVRRFSLARAVAAADREMDAEEARHEAERERARLADEAWYEEHRASLAAE